MSGRPARGPSAALARALKVNASAVGLVATITDMTARPWSSATFTGERCRVALAASGERLAEWLDALPDANLPVRGCYVAELVVLSVTGGAVLLEALVLEDS